MTASKIEWTDRSDWNPVRGCSRVTEACTNCYAEIMAARFSDPGMWGHGFAKIVKLPGGRIDHRWTGKVALQEDRLLKPMSWRKPAKVFPNSTSDFFHEKLPFEKIDKLFAVMALCPHLTFQVLTKRPGRAREYLSDPDRHFSILDQWRRLPHNRKRRVVMNEAGQPIVQTAPSWPLLNVWLGTSVHDQESADEFIPELLATPAAVRFISAEPLLGPINLTNHQPDGTAHGWSSIWKDNTIGRPWLDWVIVGGESGHGARPMHPNWVRSLRDQCKAAAVPLFFKQWGEWLPGHHYTDELKEYDSCLEQSRFRCMDWNDNKPFETDGLAGWNDLGDHAMWRVGKDRAGRLLDGHEYSEFPNPLRVPQHH